MDRVGGDHAHALRQERVERRARAGAAGAVVAPHRPARRVDHGEAIAADAGHVRLDHAQHRHRGDAASAALPPARSVSMATRLANGCEVAAMPSQAMTGERPGS
jgi:hypothetical protein